MKKPAARDIKTCILMTYNFDPDLWYTNHLELLEQRRASGQLDEKTYRRELDDLEKRYEEMCKRLDGTYCLPKENE